MQHKFKMGIRNLVAERNDGICMEVAASDKKYIRLNGRSKRLQGEFMAYLPDEAKKMFLLYDESEAWLNGILQKAIYGKGIRDGIRFAEME